MSLEAGIPLAPADKPMPFMVTTIMCEAILAQDFTSGSRLYAKGEIIPMSYGQAIQLKALGIVGALKDEDDKHIEAVTNLGIYGADCWFPHHLQTISHVANYLAEQGFTPHAVN